MNLQRIVRVMRKGFYMRYPNKKASVLCSAAAIFSVAAVTMGLVIRRYILARRGSLKAELDSWEPSFMEDLVRHNSVGF